MWKRKIPLTQILTLTSSSSNISSQNLGQAQLQKNLTYLKWATIINPHNFIAQIDLADSLFKLGKENEALSSIKKGLTLLPGSYESSYLHNFLIRALKNKQKLDELESFINEIADTIVDPKSVPYFYLTNAEALKAKGMFPQALKAYRKAMKDNPPIQYYEHYDYGQLLQREGFYEEALAQFEQVKKLGPSQNKDQINFSNFVVSAWAKTASLNYSLGRVQKAKEEFEYAIANKLEAPLTYTGYFLVLYHMGGNERVTLQCKEGIRKFASGCSFGEDKADKVYEKEREETQKILERNNIDEETRDFNIKKLEGINALLPLVNKAIADYEDSRTYW